MQVYKIPATVREPEWEEYLTDNRYDMQKSDEVDAKFYADLKAALVAQGYTGPLTGELVRFPQGDGYATYVVADAPRRMCLIHSPLHDAWHIPEAHMRGLRKADIVERVAQEKRIGALFGRSKHAMKES